MRQRRREFLGNKWLHIPEEKSYWKIISCSKIVWLKNVVKLLIQSESQVGK
jgi:hypothetical protein